MISRESSIHRGHFLLLIELFSSHFEYLRAERMKWITRTWVHAKKRKILKKLSFRKLDHHQFLTCFSKSFVLLSISSLSLWAINNFASRVALKHQYILCSINNFWRLSETSTYTNRPFSFSSSKLFFRRANSTADPSDNWRKSLYNFLFASNNLQVPEISTNPSRFLLDFLHFLLKISFFLSGIAQLRFE